MERLATAETLALWVKEADEAAQAADLVKGTLATAEAHLGSIEDERSRIAKLFAKGHISEDEMDDLFAELEATRVEAEARVARLSRDLAKELAFAWTMEELLDVSVSVLGITPADEGEQDADGRMVEPSWADVMRMLGSQAEKVLAGDAAALAPWAVAWLQAAVELFDIKAAVRDAGGDAPEVSFTAVVDLNGPLVMGEALPERGRRSASPGTPR